MILVSFPEQTCVIAKDQPQYMSMPAHIDPETRVVTCVWQLSFKERVKLLFTGKVWHRILTFGNALQPQKLTLDSPFVRVK